MRWQAITSLLSISMLAVAAQSAQAHGGPSLFVWPKPPIGFHGEADLIRALQWLGTEFTNPTPYHLGARRAEVLVKRAYTVLCSPIARNETLVAIGHLRNYRLTDNRAYLQAAARSIQRALQVEHRCHFRPVPVPAPPVPPVPVITPAVPAPAPPVLITPQPVPVGGIFFGGKHWSVGITF